MLTAPLTEGLSTVDNRCYCRPALQIDDHLWFHTVINGGLATIRRPVHTADGSTDTYIVYMGQSYIVADPIDLDELSALSDLPDPLDALSDLADLPDPLDELSDPFWSDFEACIVNDPIG
jgi:hypothetical protein